VREHDVGIPVNPGCSFSLLIGLFFVWFLHQRYLLFLPRLECNG